jgi:hypothetical protein
MRRFASSLLLTGTLVAGGAAVPALVALAAAPTAAAVSAAPAAQVQVMVSAAGDNVRYHS